ncbi:MAG: hypothetical protein P1V20_24285 [Verrucomicrobiales bacterium]|nr:hypothetical protein [Verrucomicrobiales bacterium]
MKPASILVVFSFFLLGHLSAQQMEIPLRSGPSLNCPTVACICPNADLDFCKVCEKVDSCGRVWAKIEVKGQVKVRQGGTRYLSRLMNRDHEWQVLPCRCPVYLCQQCEVPVMKLQSCSVVKKVSNGLPRKGCICVCITGWVCDQGGR